MEWILFGLLFYFFYRRSQKKKWKKFQEVTINSKDQQNYEKFMLGLPALKGNGTFSQEIRGEYAYAETINLFGEYLKQLHDGANQIMVMVELEPNNPHDKNAVRVDAGGATVGHLPREDAAQFGKELAKLGGKASCRAQLYWSPNDGKSSITLDVVRPLSAD
jgi:hypothetical protein